MGRTPDYKAALMNTLGANAEYYGQFAANARSWYRRAQENVLFMNHAIVNPPVDRGRPTNEVKDVYVSIEKETDDGVIVSGAKVRRHRGGACRILFLGQNAATATSFDPDMAIMFILPMDAPGVKLICRNSSRGDRRPDSAHPTTIRCRRVSTRTTRSSCSIRC